MELEDGTRTNLAMSEVINALMRVAGLVGTRRAARAMAALDIPERVIARVLCDTDQRRPDERVSLH